MSNSFFHFKQFSILHQEKGLKVTTDACLLGAIAQAHQSENLLDIGTGTGVVALFMAQKFKALKIDAIEIEPEVAKQARLNISNSPFREQITILEADFLSWQTETKYDTIVSNPPYYKNHLRKSDSEKNIAIHADLMNHQLMISKIASVLHDNGQFYCILPPYEMGQLIEMASREGLYANSKIEIFNTPDKHYRDIVCFSRIQSNEISRTQLLLKDQKGKNTGEFHRLMSDFYLEDTAKYRKNKQ